MSKTKSPSPKTTTYTHHSHEYKQEALKLVKQIGVGKAALQLGVHESQLYQWRKAFQHAQTVSERETSLAVENARLKRELAEVQEELAIAKKAATYFAKQLK